MAETEPSALPRTSTSARLAQRMLERHRAQQRPYKPICNPCPCTSLQFGAKIIAIFECVWNIIYLIASIIALILIPNEVKNIGDTPAGVGVTILGLAILPVARLILAVLLFLGAKQLSRWKVMVFYIITWVLLIVALIIIANFAASQKLHDQRNTPISVIAVSSVAYLGIYIIASFYPLIIVFFLGQEIKFKEIQAQPPEMLRGLATGIDIYRTEPGLNASFAIGILPI